MNVHYSHEEMIQKTGLENPNSPAQLKAWLKNKGINTESLGKKDVKVLIKEVPEDIADVHKYVRRRIRQLHGNGQPEALVPH